MGTVFQTKCLVLDSGFEFGQTCDLTGSKLECFNLCGSSDPLLRSPEAELGLVSNDFRECFQKEMRCYHFLLMLLHFSKSTGSKHKPLLLEEK